MSNNTPIRRVLVGALIASMSLSPIGCSRRFWRLQAQKDVYNAEFEKMTDRRWSLPRVNITPDRRSRFFDPYDPDNEPMPPDDPAAHRYMETIDGKDGYKGWHKFGRAISIENPQWLQPFGVGLDGKGCIDPVSAHSSVQLKEVTLAEAIELSYINSRDYQSQIENLYLTALDLTFERFQFGVRYLNIGGREPFANLDAEILPGREASTPANPLGVPPTLRRTLGAKRTDSLAFTNGFGISQALPAGGQWAAEFANNTLWLFGAGGQTSSSASTLAFQLAQPLLFGAGRKVVLEALTQSERNLLYSTRDLARFRKLLFTDTASGYLNLLQQRQSILNQIGNIQRTREQIEIQSFKDAADLPARFTGVLGAMPANANIPPELADRLKYDAEERMLYWTGDTMSPEDRQAVLAISDDEGFQRAVREIIGWIDTDSTSLSTTQLVNSLLSSENELRNLERRLQDSLDGYKIELGLPPDMGLEIDTSLLKPFELIDPALMDLEGRLKQVLLDVAQPEAGVDFQITKNFVDALQPLIEQLDELGLKAVERDFQPVERLLTDPNGSSGRYFVNDAERERLRNDLERDRRLYTLGTDEFSLAESDLATLQELLDGPTMEEAFKRLDKNGNDMVDLDELPEVIRTTIDVGDDRMISDLELLQTIERVAQNIRELLLRGAQGLQVVQAGLRAELVSVNRFTLPGSDQTPTIEEVVAVGLRNRLDLMNERARVTDARRQMEIRANELEAALDVVFDARTRTRPGENNPFDFRKDNSSWGVGLAFTAPVDQIAERNAYNQSLINYQRARRNYMAFEDNVKQSIRNSWRQLQVAEQQLEIDRQSIRVAALNYDQSALRATRPGGTDALNLLNSLGQVLRAQNTLLGDWINYELNRLNIYRDMGIMEVNSSGIWNDEFYLDQNSPAASGFNPQNAPPPAPRDLEEEPSDEPVTPEKLPPAPRNLDGMGRRRPGRGERDRGVGDTFVSRETRWSDRIGWLPRIPRLHH